MSQQRNSSPGPSHQDGVGEGSLPESPIKQKKLDEGTDLTTMEVPSRKTNIEDLPDECLLRIFSFCTTLELIEVIQNVSTKWQNMSHDPILWQKRKFFIGRHSDEEIVNILHKVPQLQIVIIQRSIEAPVFHALNKKCRHLNTLEIDRFATINFPLLTDWLNNCQNIQKLSIPHQLLDDENKAKVFSQLHQLQELHLTYNYPYKNPVYLQPLADGCPRLDSLEVYDYIPVLIGELEYFIKVKCNTLTRLVLPWASYNKRCIFLQLKMCTSLLFLEISDRDRNHSSVLNDEEQEALSTLGHLSTLHSLIINSYWLCKAGGISHAIQSGGLSRLQVLDITDCRMEDCFMEAICEGCPQLQELCLRFCKNLKDQALRLLYRLTKLEKLAFTSCGDLRGEAMFHVAQVPTLRKLFIELCDLRYLEPGLDYILDISSLEILSFCFTHFACNFPYDRIPGKLVNLRVLKLASCEVNTRLIRQLMQQMPGLQIDASLKEVWSNIERKFIKTWEQVILE